LATIGTSTSLRYVIQMITPSMVLAETLGKTKISKDEVDEISRIFLDGKTSAKILHEQADKYIS
jgi:RuvB-like protein 1 (pontin 52)